MSSSVPKDSQDMELNLHHSLNTHFGFSDFRPGQEEAVSGLLSGAHVLAVMPTGAGKSLIFQLAALELDGPALVISPLIALMKDQVDALQRRSIPATFINSAIPQYEQSRRLEDYVSGKYRILYAAPERLRSAAFLSALRKRPIHMLAVDEAHCISEWGHDFRPDYLNIAAARAHLGSPLTAALTATATPEVQEDIVRMLGLPASTRRIVTGFNRTNLSLDVRYTAGPEAKYTELEDLLKRRPDGATLIYTGTRRDAEEVAEFIVQVCRTKAEHYHAGLDSEQRARVQEEFISGRLNVITATNAFGMGIDRADVRQVIHFSLPGSLEAYYQEAGRAGRDGKPARVVLLYDPRDRSLQEYFIRTSQVSTQQLDSIYRSIRNGGSAWTSLEDLSRSTGIDPVGLKVGLAELERAGALEQLSGEGLRIQVRTGQWNASAIAETAGRTQLHAQSRQQKLDVMVSYAESNDCRRKIVLQYFGDTSDAHADDCCDNCRNKAITPRVAKDVEDMSGGERVALIILDTIRRLRQDIGKTKLTQILQGSRAKDILQCHYDRSPYYARLSTYRRNEIEGLLAQLTRKGYLKLIGGDYPVLHLTPRAETAIQLKEAIPLQLPRPLDPYAAHRKLAANAAGGTIGYTRQLFNSGKTPMQIAVERGLSPNTIYGHLAQMIVAGQIDGARIAEPEVYAQIVRAIESTGLQTTTALSLHFQEQLAYGLIQCVLEDWKRKRPGRATPSSSASALELTPTAWAGPASQALPSEIPPSAPVPVSPPPPDSPSSTQVASFLKQPHPRLLSGPWDTGWALDFHSRYDGGDWNRSVTGQLTYRLKYANDLSVLSRLAEMALALIAKQPALAQVDAVLPVPPSLERAVDPVRSFSAALARRLNLPVQTVLVKTRQTQAQKELKTLAQKRANVAGAFGLQGDVRGRRILVIDDLFDSGATLEEVTRMLKSHGAIQVNVLTLTRTIHSDD